MGARRNRESTNSREVDILGEPDTVTLSYIRQQLMRELLQKHKNLWKQREYLFSVLLSFLLIAVSLGINYLAGTYASRSASNAVTDILLDHLPVLNVDPIFVEGFAIFLIFVLVLLLNEPKRIPFVLKTTALFICIRAIFMSLTHIGPFPEQTTIESGPIIRYINFTGDLFFSGHTGTPYLMALIFWENKTLRWIFIGISLLFAAAVLLGYLHYSIDVFAAFFITFTIFHLAKNFFAKDYQLFKA